MIFVFNENNARFLFAHVAIVRSSVLMFIDLEKKGEVKFGLAICPCGLLVGYCEVLVFDVESAVHPAV